MKRLFALAAIIVVGVFVVSATSQEKNGDSPKDVKTFMRAKLVHSQKVLEGLTLEDFDSIVKHTQQLSLLSQDASWNVIATPEYYERSADFRRSLDDLKAAARKRNLDGAALGYVGVTLKCIECHRYVRTVQHVEAK
jgi:hypothetical protein